MANLLTVADDTVLQLTQFDVLADRAPAADNTEIETRHLLGTEPFTGVTHEEFGRRANRRAGDIAARRPGRLMKSIGALRLPILEYAAATLDHAVRPEVVDIAGHQAKFDAVTAADRQGQLQHARRVSLTAPRPTHAIADMPADSRKEFVQAKANRHPPRHLQKSRSRNKRDRLF